MKLYYWRSREGNFGDDMNAFLWEHFLPGCFDRADDAVLLGIGTILWDGAPPARHRIVMGSGAGYGRLPRDLADPSWRMVAVRGPLTARAVGCDPSAAVTDPAALLPLMPEFLPEEKRGVSFVPHWQTAAATTAWADACARTGMHYVDPRRPAKEVVSEIAASELVITESLHGAIVADAFRTPWIAVVSSRDTPLKWHDWTQSLGMTYAPASLGALNSPAHVMRDRMKGLKPGVRPYDPDEPDRELRKLIERSAGPKEAAPAGGAPSGSKLRGLVNGAAGLVLSRSRLADLGAERLEFARRLRPSLSDEQTLRARQDLFLERLEAVRREFCPAA